MRVRRDRGFGCETGESATGSLFRRGSPKRYPVSDDPKYQLSDDGRERVARVVDSLGPADGSVVHCRSARAVVARARCGACRPSNGMAGTVGV